MQDHGWRPPTEVPREEIVALSNEVLAMPDIPGTAREDVFTLDLQGLPWDIGVRVYEPADPSRIATGADGRKIGIFWTHGGDGDCWTMHAQSLVMARKFGCKVVSFSYPGRHYLFDPSGDWPGDTVNPDGSVRTPLWHRDEIITRDQYDVIRDDTRRARNGTRIVAKAKLGTPFYYRLAAWPVVMEEGMKAACRRHFPEDDYAIYVHGHSTGGPQVSMLCQRVANIAGMLALENSMFGYINAAKHDWSGGMGRVGGHDGGTVSKPRDDGFDELNIRTWRDIARYRGAEALGQEGPAALMRLPWLMEEVLEAWEVERKRAQFKCEYLITHNIARSLEAGARVTAERLGLDREETEALVRRHCGYPFELRGPDVKPVPPILFGITENSRDHTPEVYDAVILPMLAAMDPAPRTAVIRYRAGVHTYTTPEEGLPRGVMPAAMKIYMDAIRGGYFLD